MFINIFLTLFVISTLVKVTLIWLNIKSVQDNAKIPSDFSGAITQKEHEKAQNYTLSKAKFSLISLVFERIFLLFWLFSGILNQLHTTVARYEVSSIWEGVAFLILFSVLSSIIHLPFELYSTFIIEEEYGFNKTTPKLFIIDQIKSFFLGLALGTPLLLVLLSFFDYFPQNWWIIAWAFIVSFQVLMLWAYPKFIAPLFNKFEPLENAELTWQIKALLEKIDLKFKDFYQMNASLRSSHGNAYFTGFGKNKRIVFFDTLLSTLNSKEIIAVLAHELGHLKKKHITKMMFTMALGLLAGFYCLNWLMQEETLIKAFGLEPSSAMQLLLFMLTMPVFTFFFTPISSWFSRRHEFEADEFAARYADATDLISALLKLIKDNSSTLTPHPVYSKFYFSHPPPRERINFLKSLQK